MSVVQWAWWTIALLFPTVVCLSSSPPQFADTTRYRLRVAYDGTSFSGFQVQSKTTTSKKKAPRTVQGVLEATFAQRLQVPIRIVAASRTDTGVHARGQACHLDLPNDVAARIDNQLDDVMHSLNKMLPDDCYLWNLQRAPPSCSTTMNTNDENDEAATQYRWNAMYDSLGKLYSYRLSLARAMHPVERHCRWHPDKAHTIDTDRLNQILQHFVGTHDFRAFATSVEQLEKAAGQRVNTHRTVYSVTLCDEQDGNYRIDFYLKGALYKQVRNMVKSAVDVAQHKVSEERLLELIRNKDGSLSRKDNPSKPAPPEGLTLEKVYFNDEDF